MTEQQPTDPNIKPAKDKMKKESTDCPPSPWKQKEQNQVLSR